MGDQSIGVVVDPDTPRRGNGDIPSFAAPYISEILSHAGIPFDLLLPDALEAGLTAYTLIIIAQDLRLTKEQGAGVIEFVKNGGTLIGIAGTCDMDALYGCQTQGNLGEGFLQAPGLPHPVTGGLGREIHVFGGSRVQATYGTALARIETQDGAGSDAIVEHAVGSGRTLLFAPDLVTSVLHIQQSRTTVPVPPRETARTPPALDPDRDQDEVEITEIDNLSPPDPHPGPDGKVHYNRRLFLEPMADALRGLLLRGVYYAFKRAGRPLPVLWYWPRGLQSIAHMSHDSDGQRVSQAWSLYHLLDELDVRTTWCTMPVPGWTREFFDALKKNGHEIALHYAFGRSPVRRDHRWSQTDFKWQVDTLRYMAQIPEIVSNKNHGLAWQGRLEFYKWCEGKGIQVEQTHGDNGFAFGGSHPWFPMEDQRPGGSYFDVLVLPFLTQDPTVVCPKGFIEPLADKCHAAYGVAHFLYHPSHIEDPGNEGAIRETVAYTRSLGMEWWKSDEINAWERGRRRVSIGQERSDGPGNGITCKLTAPQALPEATLHFLMPDGGSGGAASLDGAAVEYTVVERYGQRFAQVTADLSGEHEIEFHT